MLLLTPAKILAPRYSKQYIYQSPSSLACWWWSSLSSSNGEKDDMSEGGMTLLLLPLVRMNFSGRDAGGGGTGGTRRSCDRRSYSHCHIKCGGDQKSFVNRQTHSSSGWDHRYHRRVFVVWKTTSMLFLFLLPYLA
jgi:hypothetical protein